MVDKPKGPIRRLFMDVMCAAAHQGWMIGLMDGAVDNLKQVRDDARQNLQRNPGHRLSGEADKILSKAISDIEDLCAKLEQVASGGDTTPSEKDGRSPPAEDRGG